MPCRRTPERVPLGLCRVRGTSSPTGQGLSPLWGVLLQHALSCIPPFVPGWQRRGFPREVTLRGQGDTGPLPPLPGLRGLAATLMWCPPSATDFTVRGPRTGGTCCSPLPSLCLCPQAPSSQLGAGGCRGMCGPGAFRGCQSISCAIQSRRAWTGLGEPSRGRCAGVRLCQGVRLCPSVRLC